MSIFRGCSTFFHVKVLIPCLLTLLFVSCLGGPTPAPPNLAGTNPSTGASPNLAGTRSRQDTPTGEKLNPLPPESRTEIQRRLVQKALSLLGHTSLTFEGASFSSDCSGFVLAAYYLSGIDLRKEYAQKTGNGVRRLYQIALSHRLLSTGNLPVAGDVLFWDNTYDADGDGRPNDELTHTGIVVSSYSNGRIDYVHYHVSRGIVQESMNLYQPDRESLNAPMRIREPGKPRPEKWLAGQLYRAYGRLWYLQDADWVHR